ncbi:DUF455 family protein [Roseateles depolymerans]|uniref:DUF455 family protein n=1 Tax=Roseateles depolymerans TaxID=76731 RepID=UPI000B30BCC3|nr:DUF455 family protein [Roseateles depolymerans]REG20291.1 uncharacterized protein DUF455 [Roseateles depolymerans]
MELRTRALQVLLIPDPHEKADAARALFDQRDRLALDREAQLQPDAELPGRPERPRLLSVLQVPSRSPFTTQGRAALLHAIAHIEFNAIKACLHIGIKSTRSTPGLINANRIQLRPLQFS